MAAYVISRYAAAAHLTRATVLTNLITGERISVAPHLGRAVMSLEGREFTPEEFTERAGEGAETLLGMLRTRRLVVNPGTDEEEQAELLLSDDPVMTAAESGARGLRARDRSAFWTPHTFTPESLARPKQTTPLRVIGFGGCVIDFARDELARQGASRGYDVSLRTSWPDAPRRLEELRKAEALDAAVLQLSMFTHLTRVWDAGPLGEPEQRGEGVRRLKRILTQWVRAFSDALPAGCVGMVHNIGPSALSPYGRYEYLVDRNTRQVLAEVNDHVAAELRAAGNLQLVDEERMVARHGALALFDDRVFPFGHHGGSPDLRVDIPNQTPALSRVLAAEYLDLYEAATRQGVVKCIVTDLDGTLWPGIAADDGFDWTGRDSTATWSHLGLHQALLMLKSRGFLLATCSKGTEQHTLDAWRGATGPLLLTPEDFVLHRINWRRKSQNIAEIAEAVGLATEAIIFLDDNPVERLEVARSLPGVRVLDGDVTSFRERLLTDPLLDRPPTTAEASQRTETTRSMLARQEMSARYDGDDLVRELDVEVRVWKATPHELPRAAELLQRTNQFTTTAWRADIQDLERFQAAGGDVVVCAVKDKFADYGLVGVVTISDDEIDCLAISCRVIGLDVASVFLVAALNLADRTAKSLTGVFRPTGRNEAAGDVFSRVGFRSVSDGRFELGDGCLPALAGFPHQVTLVDHHTRDTLESA